MNLFIHFIDFIHSIFLTHVYQTNLDDVKTLMIDNVWGGSKTTNDSKQCKIELL